MSRNEAHAPSAELMEQMTGFYVSRAIFLATDLGMIDQLAREPGTGVAVAEKLGADPHAVTRLLRLLASAGMLVQQPDGRFVLSDKGQLLRSDVPDSLRDVVWVFAGPLTQRLWADLEHGLRTGGPVFEHAYGVPAFGYFPQHPDEGMVFNRAMTYFASKIAGAVLDVYDFSGFGTVVDVGGGHGMLVRSILRANPGVRGTVYDLPHVVATVRDEVAASDLADRCQVVGGDFFVEVPEGGDAYVLKSVIHDWNDERSLTILRNVHRVMPADGRLLIVEPVVSDQVTESPTDLMVTGSDLNMMLTVGGAERTETEYRELLALAGFTLRNITPLGGLSTGIHGVHSVIECSKIV
ncbi:methyltransferase [Salinispora arenicola]|uniref:Methyltransferase n=1 Tax=Salinispora arenicola TaxID=168697 RepID=A0A542XTD4_SALAC|nr:methyltransferase [Salinispora arenicola]MCN0151997.1 acetylserotonin O-methyltransferase [Salinispora arenicola]TQL39092.1 methyltransferase family protein [Salinispora arenicola]GIM86911.1 methyltransferase [Salinispora arenicola]